MTTTKSKWSDVASDPRGRFYIGVGLAVAGIFYYSAPLGFIVAGILIAVGGITPSDTRSGS